MGGSGSSFPSVKTGPRLLTDLRDRRERTEAGNCAAAGRAISALPDMRLLLMRRGNVAPFRPLCAIFPVTPVTFQAASHSW